MKPSILRDKSFAFALQVVRLSQDLQQNQREFVLSKQILRSGTAIGALVREGEFAQSKSDFINKFSIALKEANETEYWILLLQGAKLIKDELARSEERRVGKSVDLEGRGSVNMKTHDR